MRDNEVEVIIKGQGQKQYESYPYSFVWINLYLAASLKLKQRYVDGKKDRQQAWQIPYAPPIYMYMACYTILGPKI